MKQILLTKNQFTLVDEADYKLLNEWKWCAIDGRNSFYAGRGITINGQHRILMMHRFLLGLDFGDKKQGEHKNGNGLDNQRQNLRISNQAENVHNSRPQLGSSCFKGVYWHKKNQNWVAQVTIEGKRKHLGSFINETEAAKTYDKKAKELFGEFAYLNFTGAQAKMKARIETNLNQL